MFNLSSASASRRPVVFVLVVLLLFGSIAVMVTTAQDIDLRGMAAVDGLSGDETAYYEYVAPRLDRLVTEVDDVVVMVEGKSRDILALTISGARIEELAGEIVDYGEQHGVPDRFAGVHTSILNATEIATYTFGQARESLRTFDFSRMTGLVEDFRSAADGLHRAQAEMEATTGGTEDASSSPKAEAR